VLTKRLSSLFVFALMVLLICSPAVLAQTTTTDNSGALGGGLGIVGGICCFILALASFACGIYALYFLYTDAQARSGNGVLWLLLGLFLGWPWVLIVWLIIRPERRV
jgi:hypothetical protein